MDRSAGGRDGASALVSSAITVKTAGPDLRDRISDGFLASLMCAGNDLQHQNMTALLSGPYASAGSFSVTPENFEQAMVVHAVRRLPKARWDNDRDPFMQPHGPLPQEFIDDCVVWSLYSNSNNTVAMRDVEYAGHTFQMANHLFPVQLARLRRWQVGDPEITVQLPTAEERFAARWLAAQTLTAEAAAVVAAGETVFRTFYEHMHQMRLAKFKIRSWDAGWWQVRSALKDRELAVDALAALKVAHDALKQKLLPLIESLGFIR